MQTTKRKRRAYTAAELAEVWDRWGRGEPCDKIARAMNRGTNVYMLLARRVGIRPRTRCRSARVLSLGEREEISRGLASGQSLRSMARGTEPFTFDGEPRGPAQRRPDPLSGLGSRQAGLEEGTASETVPTGVPAPTAPARGREAARGLGTTTDHGLAEADVSWR